MSSANNTHYFKKSLTKSDILKKPPAKDETLLGLPRKEVGILIAPGATGKSFFVLNILLASCELTKNHLVKNSLKVLYVSLEDNLDDIQRRMYSYKKALNLNETKLNENKELSFEIICYKGADRLISKKVEQSKNPLWKEFKQKIQDSNADLVIIDTLIKTYEGYLENDNPDMSIVLSYFNEVAIEKDCSILLLHHTNKGAINSDTQSQTDSRGASAIVDNSRWVVSLKKDEDESSIICQSVKTNFTASSNCTYNRRVEGTLIMETEDVA